MYDKAVSLGQKLDEIIKTLSTLGKDPECRSRWYEIAKIKWSENEAKSFKFHSVEFYYDQFALGSNPRKLLDRRSTKPENKRELPAEFIRNAFEFVRRFGYCRTLDTPQNLRSQHDFLDKLSAELAGPLPASPPPEASESRSLADSQWRTLTRNQLVKAVIASLASRRAVAIVGMSGSGKTVLLRQLAETLKREAHPVFNFDAGPCSRPIRSGHRPTEASYVRLFAEMISKIAGASQQTTLNPAQEPEFDRLFRVFRDRLYDRTYSSASGAPEDPHQKGLLDALEARRKDVSKWPGFVEAVANHGAQLTDTTVVVELAALLGLGAAHVFVIVDDAWYFQAARSFVEPLFLRARKFPTSLGPRLVVASQQTGNVLFLGREAIHDLDPPCTAKGAITNRRFSYRVAAAWAVGAEAGLSRTTVCRRMIAFRREYIEPIKSSFEATVDKLGGNPLAIAVLASAWRIAGRGLPDSHFWAECCQALKYDPEELLTLPPGEESGIEPRHENVVSALQFAWRALPEEVQDHYLDLGVSPEGEPICQELFKVWWRWRAHQAQEHAPVSSLTLQQFIDNALVRPALGERDGYVLHELQRSMIDAALKSAKTARADRHRELLKACGIISRRGTFVLNEERHFETDSALHTRLRPVPAIEVTDQEARVIGAYMLKHLVNHLKQAELGTNGTSAVAECATTFRLLQAILDSSPERSTAHSRPARENAGNVEDLLRFLNDANVPELSSVFRAVRTAAPALFTDRQELGAQLHARLEKERSAAIDKLLEGAATYRSCQSAFPRYSFLSGSLNDVICSLRDGDAHIIDAEWLPHFDGGPAVLTWGGSVVKIWNPVTWTGRTIATCQASDFFRHAQWISELDGDPAVLTCSKRGEVRLRNPITGESRRSWQIPLNEEKNEVVRSAEWIANGAASSSLVCIFAHANSFGQTLGSTVSIWDGKVRRECHRWAMQEAVERVSWIDDAFGKPAILGQFSGGKTFLLDPISGEKCDWPLERDDIAIFDATWLSDPRGRPMIVGWSWGDYRVAFWDPVTGKRHQHPRIDTIADYVTSIPMAFDGPAILTKHPFGSVELWDVETGDELGSYVPPREIRYQKPRWVPDALGQPAILGCSDLGRVLVWAVAAPRNGNASVDRIRDASPVGWGVDALGTQVIVARSGDRLNAYSPTTGNKLPWSERTYRQPLVRGRTTITNSRGKPIDRQWSYVALSDRSIYLLDPTGMARAAQVMSNDTDQVSAPALIPDAITGPALLSTYETCVFLCDPITGRHQVRSLTHQGLAKGARWIRTKEGRPKILSWAVYKFYVWDLETGTSRIFRASKSSGKAVQATWIADISGKSPVLCTCDNSVFLWDPETAETWEILTAPISTICPVWLAGEHTGSVALGKVAHTGCIVDGTNPPNICLIKGKPGPGLDLIPETRREISYLVRGGHFVFELITLDPRGERTIVSIKHDGAIKGAKLIENPIRTIVSWSADCTIRFWNAETGVELSRFICDHPVEWVSVSPESRDAKITFAAGCTDGTVGIFDYQVLH